jgi:hypothetical protein
VLFDKDDQWRYTTIARRRRTPDASFEGEDEMIAEAMALHPELDPIWEQGELSASPQEVNGTVVNPFIHTALHVVIEKQVQDKSPVEVVETLNTLTTRGMDRHEVVHRIAELFAHVYFTTFRRGQSFEETSYTELLKQLGSSEG